MEQPWEKALAAAETDSEEIVSAGWWTPKETGESFVGKYTEFVKDGSKHGDLVRCTGVPIHPDGTVTEIEGTYAMGGADLIGKLKNLEEGTPVRIFFTGTVDTGQGQPMKAYRVFNPMKETVSS